LSAGEQSLHVPISGIDGLEALLVDEGAASPVPVAAPHPLYGGDMHNPVVVALCSALRARGRGTLRFNWRRNASGDAAQGMADCRAALDCARGLARVGEPLPLVEEQPVLFAGYSFGAVSVLQLAASLGLAGKLLLVAPPPALLAGMDLERLAAGVHILVGAEDEYAPVADLEALLESLPGPVNARLSVLDGVDHFFATGGLDSIAAFVGKALG
jgi:alpha/beta superfamily hydrolase